MPILQEVLLAVCLIHTQNSASIFHTLAHKPIHATSPLLDPYNNLIFWFLLLSPLIAFPYAKAGVIFKIIPQMVSLPCLKIL